MAARRQGRRRSRGDQRDSSDNTQSQASESNGNVRRVSRESVSEFVRSDRVRNVIFAITAAAILILLFILFALLITQLSQPTEDTAGNEGEEQTQTDGDEPTDSETGERPDTLTPLEDEGQGNEQTDQGSQDTNQPDQNSDIFGDTAQEQEQPEVLGNGSDSGNNSTQDSYTERARAGDGVSHLARRAINKYLEDKGENLGRAKKLYFEVKLTNQSKPKWLEVGDARTFDVSTMDNLFEKAQDLSGPTLQNWREAAVSSGYR